MVQQSISIIQVLEYTGVLLTIIVSGIVIARQIRRGILEYVDGKNELMNNRINNIEKEKKKLTI
jgi:hypothetical protein